MKNKEQFLDFFVSGHLNLSQYDYRFLTGIKMIIESGKSITTNQSNLFDRLVQKYRKQLTKASINVNAAINLPWETPIVETSAEHASARVFVENDKLIVRVPFNRKFINHMNQTNRNTILSPSSMVWNSNTKRYEAPFLTHILKNMVNTLPKFFDSVIYQDEIQKFLDEAALYQNQVWNPTLVEVNGNLVVMAVNQQLAEHIKDIKLEKTPECLFNLSTFGVAVDDRILNESLVYRIAGSFSPTIVSEEFEDTLIALRSIGLNNIAFSNRILSNPHYGPIIKNIMSKGESLVSARGYTNTYNIIDAYITEASGHAVSGVRKKITLIDIK